MTRGTAVVVDALTVVTPQSDRIVDDLSLSVSTGEILGLVGESGSGKTTVGLAILGYTRRGARWVGGSISVAGARMEDLNEESLRRVRGRLVSYVPQDPATALNPSMRIGALLTELVETHRPNLGSEAAVGEALSRVQLPDGRAFRRRYPHQLSGGQQQRLALAMAFICEPPVVVLDEPTTGLDVVTQALLLAEVKRLRDELGTAMIYISHDLAVVAEVADRVSVMYAGRVVEEGPTESVLLSPRHPYTFGLVSSIPDHTAPRRLRGLPGVGVAVGERPRGCAFAARCVLREARCEESMPTLDDVAHGWRVRCFRWRATPSYQAESRINPTLTTTESLLSVKNLDAEYDGRQGPVIAARDVTFDILRGECLALVGESGSGKTTIARCIVGLYVPRAGSISLGGTRLAPKARERPREARRRLQIVFQNPYDSLNPRETVERSVFWAARRLRNVSKSQARRDVATMLERVRLSQHIASRYPRELSGGERQRVAIARALVALPDVLVCDEITSSLDVSIQAAILELLGELQRDLGLAMLFITHDLGVVASVANRVIVLEQGSICEQGLVDDILSRPSHMYTRRLLKAAPRVLAARVLP